MSAASIAIRKGNFGVCRILAEAGSVDAAPLLLGAACYSGSPNEAREALADKGKAVARRHAFVDREGPSVITCGGAATC